MNEEPRESPLPGREPVEKDVVQSTEKNSSEAENTSEVAPTREPLGTPGDETEEAKATGGEPPVDWFEPLEDDDDSFGRNDPEEESLAGESEKSESVADSEKTFRRIYQLQLPRRKRSHPDEGWDDWPILGEGWKRKEVVRRSGSSIGQKDVYYLSPRGDRVRSRVELISVLEGMFDLSTFEYKSGKFLDALSCFPAGSVPDVVFPSQAHGMTNKGRGPAVPAVGVCQFKTVKGALSDWIPCGQCVGCHNTVNCGQCANCKHGQQSKESRKRLCRKRKCICPIRKVRCRHPSLKSSDTENFSVNVDVDDEDDMSTDDDDDRRSCGECKACLCRKDCGTCDFCIDKPKFGGSNKKRQKCRLRQCQRQAMRHLLPFQMGQGDYGPDGSMLPGRPRPHYTYSRKSGLKKNKGPLSGLDLTDNEDEDSNLQAVSSQYLYETTVVYLFSLQSVAVQITQIFSLADNPSGSGADMENQLMKLLHSLRSTVMPILWYAIMVEGPQIQLIQCCKQSNLTDTMVLIDPGFCYQVTVQKQPLLPTHPLYDNYPAHLTSVTDVINLLLGLEKYVVCQGLPPKEPLSNTDPIILERASTCDFLVKRNVSRCTNCRALQGL
uniref:Methyl-CpG binding domain protein 1b n=1 Tax=Sander lucioperca TaxID=283035 RepID=A0A8D0A6V2_SANLU